MMPLKSKLDCFETQKASLADAPKKANSSVMLPFKKNRLVRYVALKKAIVCSETKKANLAAVLKNLIALKLKKQAWQLRRPFKSMFARYGA